MAIVYAVLLVYWDMAPPITVMYLGIVLVTGGCAA